ncbi:MAG TPA: hypothetical protein VF116_15195 [Ktedonobacterales bacterium]
MRALRNIHSALRPGGVLLDMQPARHSRLELALPDGRTLTAGAIDESPGYAATEAALDALRTVVAVGLFAPEVEREFEFLYHFDGLDEWREHMAGNWHRARVSPDLVARARELVAGHPEGALRISRTLRAARLRRL